MRKANNRQGPGLFTLAAGKLTVVIADQDINAHAGAPAGRAAAVAGVAPAVVAQATPTMAQRLAPGRDSRTLAATAAKKPAASAAAANVARNQQLQR